MSKLDKYTVGDTPAAIYLVDFLNTSGSKKDRKVLTFINEFRKLFAELVEARECDAISANTLLNFCAIYRQRLNNQCTEMINKGYNSLVVDLFSNIVLGDIRSYERREQRFQKKIKIIKAKAKKFFNENVKHLKLEAVEFFVSEPYARVEYKGTNISNINVSFEYTQDPISSAVLVTKSISRLKKQGKPFNFY